ncbi:hypothetical protein GGR92_002772 [Spirosoma lacussanchae]|uniref:DUF6934 family protein n=1 Tax=Spirosoma lacussanchae TaxID=1884249 RepID=UPI001108FB3A|nr:hypothetical protein [Spirosoma lacussanchae]
MNEPAYPFSSRNQGLYYSFYSVSDSKIVTKLVIYSPISSSVYNLALVDVQADGSLADDVTTNNQDINQVMATVIQTMLAFSDQYPDKLIYVQGSDDKRTRLYRILITRELDEAQRLFTIYGKRNDQQYEPFVKGHQYVGFLFQRNQ